MDCLKLRELMKVYESLKLFLTKNCIISLSHSLLHAKNVRHRHVSIIFSCSSHVGVWPLRVSICTAPSSPRIRRWHFGDDCRLTHLIDPICHCSLVFPGRGGPGFQNWAQWTHLCICSHKIWYVYIHNSVCQNIHTYLYMCQTILYDIYYTYVNMIYYKQIISYILTKFHRIWIL